VQHATTDGAAVSPTRHGGGSASALLEAVRRIRTGGTPSPEGGSGGAAHGAAARAPPVDVVPGGLGVLGRAHALHAATAGNGHLEPALVLSPRVAPGGVSVRLGGKGSSSKGPNVQRI
jgi:hypothetical protein